VQDRPGIHRLTDIIVEEVSLVDRAANKRKFLVVKRDEQAKAEWTTAYVNDLPDSAFLHVSPGGEKDATNRTVPRTLRHFPVRDADGALDLPHLRNAIARIPQSNLSMDIKERLQSEARRMLEEATKETEKMSTELTPDGDGFTTAAGAVDAEKGYGMMGDKKKKPMMKFDLPPGSKALLVPMLQRAAEQLQMLADETDKSTEVPLPDDGMLPPVPAEFWSSLMGVAKILAQLDGMFPNKPPMSGEIEVEDPEMEGEEMSGEVPAGVPANTEMREKSIKDVVAKVGSKMSKERLGRFEAALQTLASILTELRPSEMQPSQVSEVAARAPSKKVEETVERLAGAVGALATAVKTQRDELATLRKSRATGNALAPEVGSARGDDMVSWPLDMNSPITRDGVSKSESFFDE
jgi:hypothetical protein